MKSDNIIKNALILFVITITAGALLGLVSEVTKEPIAKQELLAKEKANKTVLVDADNFNSIDFEINEDERIVITEINEGTSNGEVIGYSFIVATPEGYGGQIKLAVGVTVEGEIAGVDILEMSETPGLGTKAGDEAFLGQFLGREAEQFRLEDIDDISGATVTSNAVKNAVNVVMEYVIESNMLEGSIQ